MENLRCVSDSLIGHAIASAKFDTNAEQRYRHNLFQRSLMPGMVQSLRISMELSLNIDEYKAKCLEQMYCAIEFYRGNKHKTPAKPERTEHDVVEIGQTRQGATECEKASRQA
jgi:hypothetical protein